MLEAEGARVEAAARGRGRGGRPSERGPRSSCVTSGYRTSTGWRWRAGCGAREALAGTRLIALTGYGQAEDVRQAIAAGFDAHLTKPVNIDQLMALLAARDEPLTGARPAA